jgi:hypothetical protein
MNETEAKTALDRFLADNDELEQLSAQLATFNIFRALKVEEVEIRHSNTLGWLLDPAESHGLGDVFLRRILSNILLESNADIEGLSAAQVELMDFSDIEVRREWKHIDVLVIDRKNRLVLLIENKVGSGEGPGQLARYRKTVLHEFQGFTVVSVFLTLEGKSSEDQEASKYISYSHARLLGVLDRIIKQRCEQMPEAVVTFLAHYTNTLRRLTMQDNALIDLCQKIYRKHREAIKLIVEYGEVSSFSQLATEIVGHADCEILKKNPNNVWFIPNTWAKVVPENGTAWTFLWRPVSVVCWMDLWQDKISLLFEVSRMTDPALRMACVKALSESGFKLTKRAFKEGATYSRFYRSSRPVRASGDEKEMRDAMERLVGKAKEEFPKVEAVLKGVFLGKQAKEKERG